MAQQHLNPVPEPAASGTSTPASSRDEEASSSSYSSCRLSCSSCGTNSGFSSWTAGERTTAGSALSTATIAGPSGGVSSSDTGGSLPAERAPPSDEPCSSNPMAYTIDDDDVPVLNFASHGRQNPVGTSTTCHTPFDLLVKPSRHPSNRSLWWLVVNGRDLVAKVVPCHSDHHAEVCWADKELGIHFMPNGRRRADVTLVQHALVEACMADGASGDVFVRPLHVFVRMCSLVGSAVDAGHDLEVVMLYPYHPAGNALEYLGRVAILFATAAVARSNPEPELEPEAAGAEVAYEVCDWALAMVGLVRQVHDQGLVIQDHKPENMVKTIDGASGGYRLIDAEFVVRCAPGAVCLEPYAGTPYYAAPEQAAERWSDTRSDMYACGRSIHRIVEVCLDVFAEVLVTGTNAHTRAVRVFLTLIEPVLRLERSCTKPSPGMRTTAAAAFDTLQEYMTEFSATSAADA